MTLLHVARRPQKTRKRAPFSLSLRLSFSQTPVIGLSDCLAVCSPRRRSPKVGQRASAGLRNSSRFCSEGSNVVVLQKRLKVRHSSYFLFPFVLQPLGSPRTANPLQILNIGCGFRQVSKWTLTGSLGWNQMVLGRTSCAVSELQA